MSYKYFGFPVINRRFPRVYYGGRDYRPYYFNPYYYPYVSPYFNPYFRP